MDSQLDNQLLTNAKLETQRQHFSRVLCIIYGWLIIKTILKA